MLFFNGEQTDILNALSKAEKNVSELDSGHISGFEVACKTYFDSSEGKPIKIATFMAQNTENNI
jgi:hypothetical protein